MRVRRLALVAAICWAVACLLTFKTPHCLAAEECPGGVCPVPMLGETALAFDAGQAYRDLVKQCEFGPRVPGTKAHEDCAAWLIGQLKPSADSVTTQRFQVKVSGETLRLTNVIATINPKGKGHVLLCAHWDSRPHADQEPDPKKRSRPVPGANDGASGVAVLLEMARVLKAHPPKQKVTMVLFDGEDYGTDVKTMLLGSRHFAAHYRGERPDFAVLLDMVGDKNLHIPKERYSVRRAGEVVERVWSAAARAGSKAFVREIGPAVMDDHIPLLEKGIPCIDIIDFDYPYWHTTADTPDKCSAASLGQVGRALLEALR